MSSSPSEPQVPGTRPSSTGPDREPAPGERTATHELWELLRRPFNVVEAVDSVLGLSPNVVKQLTGAMLATCREAEALLAATPKTIRSLSISMSNQAEECRGELRGPVLWSETFSCRSSSAGRNDVYVCAAPSRAYDIPENRVLVAALLSVLAALVGLYASYYANIASGAAIVLTLTAFFVLAFLLAPRRGLLWRRRQARGQRPEA